MRQVTRRDLELLNRYFCVEGCYQMFTNVDARSKTRISMNGGD